MPGGEALQASEHHLRLVIDTIPGLVWSARPDGSAEFFNEQYLDYVGLSAEQAQDRGWTVAVHPDDRNRLAAYWQSVLESGKQNEIEARIRRFDGVYRWCLLRANPLRDGSGRIVKWYGTNTDIEDRKRTEAELRGSEEMHRIIFEAANDAVISIHEHGTILLANPATERIFGYDPIELIGQPLTVLMPEYLRKLHEAGFTRYQLTGERHLNWQGTEVTGLRKNGLEFPAEVSFGEITKNGRRVFTGFIRDITAKKRAEEALRASEESLRMIVDSIPGLICTMTGDGQFDLANRRFLDYTGRTRSKMSDWPEMVHPDDLPAVVSQLTASLETGCTFDTEVRLRRADSVYRWFQCCGLPLHNSDGHIVRWYILFTDIEDRKCAEDALRASERDLSAIINTIPMLAWSSRPDGFCDFLNQRWLQQVLLNLLLNGIEAMDSVHERSRKLAVRSTQDSPETVLVEVQDNGVGLENPVTAFEAFVTTKQDGMGMGLAICRSIVEAHNGRLWAVSAEGAGATFCFTLPVRVSDES